MIIKSMSRKNGIRQLVNYILKEEKNIDKQPFTMRHNLNGRDSSRWIKQLEFNESLRKTKRADQVKIYHEVMSFGIGDTLSKNMMRDLCKQFVKERGDDNLYIFREHQDKSHQHIHIAMSGSKLLTGKANRISKAEFDQFRKNMEQYQIKNYPELKNSIVYVKTKNKATVIKPLRQEYKGQLLELVQSFNSKLSTEIEREIRNAGHEPYYRKGELVGICHQGGMKFRLSKLGYQKDKTNELNQEGIQLQELDDLRNNVNTRNPNERYRFNDKENENDTNCEEETNIQDDTDYER